MINVVIVDDEEPARNVISGLLTEFFPNKFNILALCDSVDSAVIAVLEKQPDLVFLDIQMPKKNGFQLLKMIPDRKFDVVFTTAFSEYAIKAIKYSALDYLLKPIDLRELRELVVKIDAKKINTNNSETDLAILENISHPKPTTISIPTERSIELVNIKNILYCEASGSYSKLFLKDGKVLLVSKPLKYFDNMLDQKDFIKTHKSFLINKKTVRRFLKNEECLELDSGVKVPISVRKKPTIMEWLKMKTN